MTRNRCKRLTHSHDGRFDRARPAWEIGPQRAARRARTRAGTRGNRPGDGFNSGRAEERRPERAPGRNSRGAWRPKHRADRAHGGRQDCARTEAGGPPRPPLRRRRQRDRSTPPAPRSAKSLPSTASAYFRQGERKVIARLLQEAPQVLSTGGGAYMDEETRANIKAHGVSVWLKADLRVLMKRVRPTRPPAAACRGRPRDRHAQADRGALPGLCRGRHHRGEPRRAA